MINSLCVVSQRYPCKETPTVHVFVQKLVWAFADQGVKMVVISPVSILEKKYRKTPYSYIEVTDEGSQIQIYRPRYLYLGQKCRVPIQTSHLSENYFFRACTKVIDKNGIKADAFYGHFICLAGICACRLGERYHKPSFFAYGESTDWSYKNYGLDNVRNELKEITGVISVSSQNKKTLIDQKIVPEDRIEVFINAINKERFFLRDKKESRSRFDLSEDDFVVSFVGQFVERKGVLRANEAIKRNKGVKALFAGSGIQVPTGDWVKFAGRMLPEDVPYMLSASDVFVFPSTNEGCSNAIIEAMACGLPIIASDLPFNYDILDDSNSILVDGNNIAQISSAIARLKNDAGMRKKMSQASLRKVKNLSITQRAINILEWMHSVILRNTEDI